MQFSRFFVSLKAVILLTGLFFGMANIRFCFFNPNLFVKFFLGLNLSQLVHHQQNSASPDCENAPEGLQNIATFVDPKYDKSQRESIHRNFRSRYNGQWNCSGCC